MWFINLANHKATEIIPKDLTWSQKKKFLSNAKYYVWDEPYLFKIGVNSLLRRCVRKEEVRIIIWHCHNLPYGGNYNGLRAATQVLHSGFYWPSLFKDAHMHAQNCDSCQRVGGISKQNEFPFQSMLEVEVFDCWGIDYVGPFPTSFSNE